MDPAWRKTRPKHKCTSGLLPFEDPDHRIPSPLFGLFSLELIKFMGHVISNWTSYNTFLCQGIIGFSSNQWKYTKYSVNQKNKTKQFPKSNIGDCCSQIYTNRQPRHNGALKGSQSASCKLSVVPVKAEPPAVLAKGQRCLM